MDDIVVGTLCKGRIDIAEGLQAFFRHTAREGDGMSLRDAHVEGALRHGIHHEVHGTAREHGWRDANDARIFFCEFHERMSKDILEFGNAVGILAHDATSAFWIELARRMPLRCRLLSGLETLSFDRVDVEELRPLHVFDFRKDAHEFFHVVAVGWAEVADVHALKDVVLIGEQRFERIVETQDAPATLIAEHAPRREAVGDAEAQFVVASAGM